MQDGETEAQRGNVTLLRPHSWEIVELGSDPGSLVSEHTLNQYPTRVFGACKLGVGAEASSYGWRGLQGQTGLPAEDREGDGGPPRGAGGKWESLDGAVCAQPACRWQEGRMS